MKLILDDGRELNATLSEEEIAKICTKEVSNDKDFEEQINGLTTIGLHERSLKAKEDGRKYSNSISDGNVSDNSNRSTLQEINNFQDYGFTADFTGEILKEVNGWYIGYFIHDGTILSAKWSKDGSVLSRMSDSFKWYNLTPIKKAWYEYPENFPALVIGSNKPFIVDDLSHIAIANVKKGSLRLATIEERDSLYVGDNDD